MPVTVRVQKIIWGQFAGYCVLCSEPVVEEGARGKVSLVGEVAHIVGEKKSAARGMGSMPLAERNEPDNLILICVKHHKIIDDDEVEYTIEKLHEIKAKYLTALKEKLSKTRPWKLRVSHISYLNVPRVSELARSYGYEINLSHFDQNKTLHSVGWNLSGLLARFQKTLERVAIDAIESASISRAHESYIGSLVAFQSTRFRSKNIGYDAMSAKERVNVKFVGDLKRDPHIYTKLNDSILALNIDENWITTSTAFTQFKPSGGWAVFSGFARITSCDYANAAMIGSPLVLGLPTNEFTDMLRGRSNDPSGNESGSTAGLLKRFEALIDLKSALIDPTYFLPPPLNCDVCGKDFLSEKFMADTAVHKNGPWGCICAECFLEAEAALGVGHGQLYLQTSEGWLLIAGGYGDRRHLS